jgi:hypothetical protein
VGLERVLAEDGLALGVVELEIDPVHAVDDLACRVLGIAPGALLEIRAI